VAKMDMSFRFLGAEVGEREGYVVLVDGDMVEEKFGLQTTSPLPAPHTSLRGRQETTAILSREDILDVNFWSPNTKSNISPQEGGWRR